MCVECEPFWVNTVRSIVVKALCYKPGGSRVRYQMRRFF
jgi:hypothetical protein